MLRRTQGFVCAECNQSVPQPLEKGGFLRCEQGHKVQGLNDRPLWREIGVTIVIALCISGFLISIGGSLSGKAQAVALVVCALYAAWSVFLLSRWIRYRDAQGVVTQLAPQYLGSAVGFLASAILLAAGVTAGLI